jgi:Calcineurin-like phosphoesterase
MLDIDSTGKYWSRKHREFSGFTYHLKNILVSYVILSSFTAVSPWFTHNNNNDGSSVNYSNNKNKESKVVDQIYSASTSSASEGYHSALASLSSGNYNNTTNNDFNFVAVGDWSCNPNTQNVVNSIITKEPELVLNLGDNSYEATANCWLEIVDPIDEKMKIVIGNHDVDEDPALLPVYMNHFNLTDPYYSFDYGSIHFVAMSTDIDTIPHEEGSPQYAFVEDDLASASSNPAIDWIVIFYHNLGYGGSPSDGPNGHRSIIKYHELFEKYGVDFVFQGHLHNYQRTYPLKYNHDSPREPIIASREKHNYYSGDNATSPLASNLNASSLTSGGQIYLIVGTGGAAFSPLEGQSPYVIYHHDDTYGFLNMDVTNNGQTITGKFFATDGTTKDQFSLHKFSTK